ncbi:hypothetical protein FRC12_022310 [Ceratobasidium sp. 428]|nr:hypothetical protein FRC12_022310 [Ceratobasidium sp. 428]
MGRTIAVRNDGPHVMDTELIFRNIQVQPTLLRVDTFPVYPSPVFSFRLTVFHFFSGTCPPYRLDLLEWQKILSATPNLVELSLWHPAHGDTASLPSPSPVNLLSLEKLKLTGLFVRLSGLFVQSQLPNLEILSLDSLDSSSALPQQITDIALVSPFLEHLRVGSMVFRPDNPNPTRWVKPLRALGSLKKIEFFETEWNETTAILEWLDVLPSRPALHVQFERIYDIKLDDLDKKELTGYISSTELIDCVEGKSGRCNCPAEQSECQSEDGSNCNSLFCSHPKQLSNSLPLYTDAEGRSSRCIYELTSEEFSSSESEFSCESYNTDDGEGQDN